MTRYEELCIRKDQLEAQLREIRRNMDVDDNQEGQEYLFTQLDEVQAEIARVKALIEREQEG